MKDTSTTYENPALPSVRGIVLGVDRNGEAVDLAALRQWLRLNAEKFHAWKVDYWSPDGDPRRILPLLEEASHLELRLSLRTSAPCDAEALESMRDAGLLDVYFCPESLEVERLQSWVTACSALELPLRVQMSIRQFDAPLTEAMLAPLAEANVVVLVLQDPLFRETLHRARPMDKASLTHALACATVLRTRGVDVQLVGLPFCHVPEALWPCVLNGPQQIASHSHYLLEALAFATRIAPLPGRRMHQAIEIALGEGVSFHSLVDQTVLPWILEKPRWFFWLWFLHKLTRRLPMRRRKPAPLPDGVSHVEAALAKREEDQQRTLGPICSACRLQSICDHLTEPFQGAFPGSLPKAVPGAVSRDPLEFRRLATPWYDALDSTRRTIPEQRRVLARAAVRIVQNETAAREIPAEHYAIENHATHYMPASVRWFSFSTAELQSTVLARVRPPLTLAVTFGGGFADQIGFCFGRHARILCPMTAVSHKLVLHVDAQGRYVLLRDGQLVNPVAFRDEGPPPERLASVLEPRIAIVNIDGQIVTQTVQIWEHEKPAESIPPVHSVVVVCTRFARRLAVVLQALAHQRGLPIQQLEVIVAYVPGIDSTDDVLDTLQIACPALKLHRVPFGERRTRAKGFMINECVALASGEWITLLDADIVLPPDYFARLDTLGATAQFVAPEGRHMLTPEATARILLGEIRPWEDYNSLHAHAVEYRHHESDGVPPGFCQSIRRSVFETVRYEELDHFEGSDWWFSKRVLAQFGPETRLDGLGVLHLDHGGSQWYGTGKQR